MLWVLWVVDSDLGIRLGAGEEDDVDVREHATGPHRELEALDGGNVDVVTVGGPHERPPRFRAWR